MGLTALDLLVILLYTLLMIAIGWLSMRLIKDQEDYFMGGRSFGKLLQVFAMFGSGTSTEEPVGVARNTFVGGLSGIWTSLNYLFVTPFYWFIGVWYRRFRMLTLGDFFAERYQSNSLAAVYALFSILFFVTWLSVSFSAASKTIVALTPKPAGELSAAENRERRLYLRLQELENADYALLGGPEREELAGLRETAPRGSFSYLGGAETIVFIGLVVLVYSWAGGLKAAYFADFIQGLFIIFLSGILIPFGLQRIAASGGSEGLFEGFRIMHQKVPQEFFDILGSPLASDFTWYYLLAVTLVNLVGIVVMPHLIVVGGGSAKDELTARVGIMAGHFIKRFLTILWTLTGLVALTLYAGQLADPDMAWGHMALQLLGPVGCGLLGLMVCAIMAALMSTASCYILTAGSLIVRNVYHWISPDRSERHYLLAGRVASALVIVGGILFSIYYYDVFGQLKVAWELPLIFAATVWTAMFWRRATRAAAWASVILTAVLFFILPALLPVAIPSLRTDERYLALTRTREVVRHYEARELDVIQRQGEIERWEKLDSQGLAHTEKPRLLTIGETIEVTTKPAGRSIYWTQGIAQVDGRRVGQGFFNPEMVLYDRLGLDLSEMANPMIETLRLPLRIVLPILIMVLVSLVTRPVDREVLLRFYARNRTPVQLDPEADRLEVERSYANPHRYDHERLLPASEFEFTRWTREDLVGFLLGILGTILVIGATLFVAGIGA